MNRTIVGTVISGNHLGREFGFPTANIAPETLTEPLPEGVFAARTSLDGHIYPSVVNIGRSPSVVDNGGIRIEVHLINFSGNLYGRKLSVEIAARIRSEQRFATREELVAQITRDRAAAIALLE